MKGHSTGAIGVACAKGWPGQPQSLRFSDLAGRGQKAVLPEEKVEAHNLARLIYANRIAVERAGKVDGGEITRDKEEAVRISRRVEVGANDLAQVVHALKKRGSSAGKIKDGEDTVVKQVA